MRRIREMNLKIIGITNYFQIFISIIHLNEITGLTKMIEDTKTEF